MAWNEDWRHEERPDPSELSGYSTLPQTRYGWQLFAYFTIIPIAFYIAIATLGTTPVFIGPLPALVVLTLLVAGAYILGLLHIRFRETAVSEEQKRRSSTDSDDHSKETA